AMRMVKKTYVAELEGDYLETTVDKKGHINLPLSPDWLDRPRQKVDREKGKEAVTDYEFISVSTGRSRVIFHPHTGRTHQLRVHAASEQGLGMPIVGDRLYGKNGGRHSDRLHLHAHKIEFIFPIDKCHYSFESPVSF
ncbi:MAG: RluA family pseudouridine synthase, partial [Muribaculaceae bacterium]|nr:RluA family pseudouridine synthase [Muribaculaceae bacterium]